jgi:preprotein translocase subunit SecY
MPFCPNPDCPHKKITGHFAEYRDGMTICPECEGPLTDAPIEVPGRVEKAKSDLGKKILMTIGLLAIFHLLALIPLPGVDLSGLPDNLLTSYFNSSRFSICALGIMPYISAYVLVEIFSLVIPPLKRWRGRKEEGRRKLLLAARCLTLILCFVQGYGLVMGLERMALPDGSLAISSSGMEFRLMVVITLTAGTFACLWIADQITAKGIGHGISMIILSGLVISLFSNLFRPSSKALHGGILMEDMVSSVLGLFISFLAVGFIVFMERGESSIKVRLKNSRLVDLPFKYNTAGVVPATFAVSIVMLASTLTYFVGHHRFSEYFQYGTLSYFITYTMITIILFFLFTSLYYDPDKILSFLRGNKAEPVLPEGVSFEKLLDKKLTLFAICGTVYLCVYSVLFSPAIHVAIVISGLSLIRLVSISLDIFDEVKARKEFGYFVKMGEFQKPYEAKFMKNVLKQNSIPCFLEGYYHRSILYFFGPYVEMSLFVQPDRESEASNIIAELSDGK